MEELLNFNAFQINYNNIKTLFYVFTTLFVKNA